MLNWSGNHTVPTKFILLGFSILPRQKYLLFSVFLSAYLITLAGNLFIIVLSLADPALHIPMYFFLRNLSFLEICYTSVNIPKILANLLPGDQTISFIGCAVQNFFFFFLAGSECILLASMAYDCYVAICKPLHYPVVMSRKVCTGLAAGSWLSGLLIFFGLTVMVFTLAFCHSHEINHFFCDIPPLLKLACGDTYCSEMAVFIMALLVPFIFIIVSYVLILSAILQIASSAGRQKAFSTCASHLLVVSLYYGTIIIMYMTPSVEVSPGFHKALSLMYTAVTPMFNPIIYSLRNKEVKGAFWKVVMQNLGMI
uniref:G-protein coupled receptors family 1 profile domain-containing protein n=1 Tax=Chelonoidis abingdonii TaxID=106734 RepID=A0A8C0H6S1_CHEAB